LVPMVFNASCDYEAAKEIEELLDQVRQIASECRFFAFGGFSSSLAKRGDPNQLLAKLQNKNEAA